VAHVDVDVGVIEWRQRPDAHELLRAYGDRGHADAVVEMRDNAVCHSLDFSGGPLLARTLATAWLKEQCGMAFVAFRPVV
jgi:hypothetical protein